MGDKKLLPPPPAVPWTILDQETLYEDNWRALRRDRLRLHTGAESSYVFLETAAAAFVVPQLADGRIALLRQYRHPLRAWVWEVPAGSLELGETPEIAGERELAEEVGGRAETWRRLGAFPTAVAHVTDHSTYLLAQGVTLGQQARELHEVAELHVLSCDDALSLARGGTESASPVYGWPAAPISAHSALALLLAEPYLRVKS